ncbi:MAG: ABC transporter ATP-binding protein [Nitrososphaerota archaeon]|nr:ABC transporter ATP-binding protein [Nitrososphaerota archaeon]MDG6971695.1 ABC transporter ATP-binding protein [Nitrososphaerota archaeon]MDG6981930.1 ABC transporter ATP-binding protein [Nitrososphaerota archaeon]
MKVAVNGMRKRFGFTVALDNVSLDFAGRVNLVLGTNGSGKSTLINVIAGVTYPQEGSLFLGTSEFRSSDRRGWRRGIEAARAKMGFMLDKPGYPAYLDGIELLEWASSKRDADWTGKIAQKLDMTAFVHRPIGGYSSGMTQKLGLGASIVSKPEVVLWDEPTANLDAPTRRSVSGLIVELAKGGTTFVIASHTPADFEGIADWMCVMRLGKVVMSGMIKDLSAGSARLIIETDKPSLLAAEALRSGLAVKAEVRDGHAELETNGAADVGSIRRIAGTVGAEVRSVEVNSRSISELYAGAIS